MERALSNISNFFRLISGIALIAGTTIGAGMLGIPLVTGAAGFWPAVSITVICWLFMLATGLLFLEVSLWMPPGSNILTMAAQFLGPKGKYIAGGMFLFLYYCLMVAYFAAGAPMLSIPGVTGYIVFGLLFGGIVAFGARAIDRTNLILTVAMIGAYFLLLNLGAPEVQVDRLQTSNWSNVWISLPVLFSAFGYHNIIPSLRTYMKGDKKTLRLSIVLGTAVALFVYLAWQWLFIGAVPQEDLIRALSQGQTATEALQASSRSPWLLTTGKCFAFFALTTSMLGVAFSLVDFLADRMKKASRIFLTLLTFIPPFLCAVVGPTIFDRALGVAGGFGEAFLNGLLPITLVWVGVYKKNFTAEINFLSGKKFLTLLFLFSLMVMGLEFYLLLR